MKELIRRIFVVILFMGSILGTAPYFRIGYTQEFLDAFAWAKTIDITNAADPDKFSPHRRLTRQERAKFLIVFSDHYLCLQTKPNIDCEFQDNQNISSALSGYVERICQYGIMK